MQPQIKIFDLYLFNVFLLPRCTHDERRLDQAAAIRCEGGERGGIATESSVGREETFRHTSPELVLPRQVPPLLADQGPRAHPSAVFGPTGVNGYPTHEQGQELGVLQDGLTCTLRRRSARVPFHGRQSCLQGPEGTQGLFFLPSASGRPKHGPHARDVCAGVMIVALSPRRISSAARVVAVLVPMITPAYRRVEVVEGSS